MFHIVMVVTVDSCCSNVHNLCEQRDEDTKHVKENCLESRGELQVGFTDRLKERR